MSPHNKKPGDEGISQTGGEKASNPSKSQIENSNTLRSPSTEPLRDALTPKGISQVYSEKRYAVVEGEELSTYDQRFAAGRENSLAEWEVIYEVFAKQFRKRAEEERLKEKRDMMQNISGIENPAKQQEASQRFFKATIFDFGCGSGRSLDLYEWMAERLQKEGIILRLKAYDIAEEGLHAYGRKLSSRGYGETIDLLKEKSEDESIQWKDSARKMVREHSQQGRLAELSEIYGEKITELLPPPAISSQEVPQKAVKQIGIYRKGNLEVELLAGDPEVVTPQIMENEIGKVDMTTVMFGPTSHIFPKENRSDYLKSFLNMTRGTIAMTLPGKAMFLGEQNRYSDPDLHQNIFGEDEQDAILYHPEGTDTGTLLPYALYDVHSLREWVQDNQAPNPEIKISSYKVHPSMASRNPVLDYLDYAASALSTALMRNFAAIYDRLPQMVTRNEYYSMFTKGRGSENENLFDDIQLESIVPAPTINPLMMESSAEIKSRITGHGSSNLIPDDDGRWDSDDDVPSKSVKLSASPETKSKRGFPSYSKLVQHVNHILGNSGGGRGHSN